MALTATVISSAVPNNSKDSGVPMRSIRLVHTHNTSQTLIKYMHHIHAAHDQLKVLWLLLVILILLVQQFVLALSLGAM